MKKKVAIIYGIGWFAFTLIICSFVKEKDGSFWGLYVSITALWTDLFFSFLHILQVKEKNSAIVDYAFLLCPILGITAVGNIYFKTPKFTLMSGVQKFSIYIVVIVIVVIVQLAVSWVRQYILGQEVAVEAKIWERGALLDKAHKIRINTEDNANQEVINLAKKIEEEIKYSDPMTADAMEDIQNRLERELEMLYDLTAQKGDEQELVKEMKAVLHTIEERNDLCKRLK